MYVVQEWMRQAKFCLAPYGYGWGIRLMKLIVAGCVPVIIQVTPYLTTCFHITTVALGTAWNAIIQ